MNLFNPNLSSSQRALLQSILTILIGSIIAGLSVALSYLSGAGLIDWQRLSIIVGLTIVFAFGHGLVTLLMSTHADLGLALDAFISVAEKRLSTAIPGVPPTPTMPAATHGPLVVIHTGNATNATPQPLQGASDAVMPVAAPSSGEQTNILPAPATSPIGPLVNPQGLPVLEHPPVMSVTTPPMPTPLVLSMSNPTDDTIPRAVIASRSAVVMPANK